MNTKTAIFISVLSGLLLGLSFNYAQYIWFISLVAIVPFFFVLDRLVVHTKKAFLLGWLFGSAFLGTVLIWFWQTLPLDWLGVDSALLGTGIVFVSWASLTAVFALFFGLATFLFCKSRKRNFFDIFLITFIWVFFEYLRMWGYAILTFGEESLFGPHFSVGFVGYVLSENYSLLQFANIGGVYTLSAIVVIVNSVLFWIFSQKEYLIRKKLISSVVFVIMLGVISAVLAYAPDTYKDSSRVIKVATIHTSFSSVAGSKNNKISVVKRLFEDIRDSGESPDIIVLPEDIRFLTTLKRNKELNSFMYDIFGDTETLIIDSSRMFNEIGEVKSRIHYYNTRTKESVADEKQFLLPYGEYTPLLYKYFLTLIGQKDLVKRLDDRRGYTKGDNERVVASFKDIKIGALFCSEALSPSLYRNLTNKYGADILVNLSSQSWFHGSKIIYNQTKAVAKVHAVKNKRAFIQSGNMSPAFILNSSGEIIIESNGNKPSVIYANVEM